MALLVGLAGGRGDRDMGGNVRGFGVEWWWQKHGGTSGVLSFQCRCKALYAFSPSHFWF